MNIFQQRLEKAFRESKSVTHEFTVRIELDGLDARNHMDSGFTIQEAVEEKLAEIPFVRSISVE